MDSSDDPQKQSQGSVNNDYEENEMHITISPQDEAFVLFGVDGARRTPGLAQIDTKKHHNDDAFFTNLQEQYKRYRGLWRYWGSIWQFHHCDFIRVRYDRTILGLIAA